MDPAVPGVPGVLTVVLGLVYGQAQTQAMVTLARQRFVLRLVNPLYHLCSLFLPYLHHLFVFFVIKAWGKKCHVHPVFYTTVSSKILFRSTRWYCLNGQGWFTGFALANLPLIHRFRNIFK